MSDKWFGKTNRKLQVGPRASILGRRERDWTNIRLLQVTNHVPTNFGLTFRLKNN